MGGPAQEGPKRFLRKHAYKNPTIRAESFWGRLRFGLYAAVSTRNVGTPYEVKGVPPFPSKDFGYVPSESLFLLRKLILLVICYLTLDLNNVVSKPEINQIIFRGSKISLADPDNWSAEALIIRSSSMLGFWINLYCVIQLYMGTIVFVAVALHFNDVESWPPGFGPVTEAYNATPILGRVLA